MIKTDKNINDVIFILDNLRDEDLEELKALWNENWYQKTLESIKNIDYMVLMGKDDNSKIVPIAVGGFSDLEHKKTKRACVWLISSKYVNFNKRSFFRNIKSQINKAFLKYEMLCNYIFVSNFEAKKWLKKMGFIFLPKSGEKFEFFYKYKEREK